MLKITTNGKWQLYWGAMPLPAGAEALGTVRRATGDTGALIRLNTGIYVQGNAGAIRTLDQRKVKAALERSAAAAALGSISSPAKAAAARANANKPPAPGKKRGRPRKSE